MLLYLDDEKEAALRLAVAAWRRYLHPAAIAEQIV